MNKRKSRLLILLSVIVALILCVGVFCACEKDEITYSVMLPSGEHYTVTSSNIVKASRGGEVAFDVNIEDGYALYSTSRGAYADNKLVVDDIKYDMTIIFDVRKKANVTYDTPNAKVEIKSIANGGLVVGEKAHLSAVANENYNLESLTINGKTIDLAPIYGGGGIPSKVVEIVLEENNLVEAITLGDEYAFTIECDSSRASYIVERDSKDEKYRYGDNITIKTEAIAPNYFGYYNYNGQLITENKPLQFTINGATGVKIQFYNEFENRIIYNPNGGIITPNAFQDILYPEGEYVNIDHCYNKITRDGYSLVGLREGLDGEIHRLGAMAKITKTNLELYAIWEEWTDSSYFLSEAIDDNTCRIVGYAPKTDTNLLTKLVIPEIIGGRKVIEIGANAFKDNQYLQEVVFSKYTTTVGEKAFANNLELLSITVFENINNVNAKAFEKSTNLVTCNINAISNDDYTNKISSMALRYNTLSEKDRASKVVVVSGSSGTNGLVGKQIEESLNMEPIVFGMHRGIGIFPLLSFIHKQVRKGDIVVLSPEYCSEMYGVIYKNPKYTYYVLQKNFDLSREFNFQKTGLFIFEALKSYNAKLSGVVTGWWKNINQYGIASSYRGGQAEEWHFTGELIDINKDLITDSSIAEINTYIDTMVGNGAKVYFSFPPANKSGFADICKEKSYRMDFVNLLKNTFSKYGSKVSFISDMEKYFWSGKYFCDTNYHMSSEGAALRTAQLCEDIKAQLAKEGK